MDMARRVEEWSTDALEAALALVVGGAACSAADAPSDSSSTTAMDTSTQVPSMSLTPEVKEARRLVSATVERSRKVFGTLYSALPEELRAQAAHIAQGWAYGLWHWLEAKFQSTEQDSVGELLEQWTSLRQQEDETFDAYRARVNRLHALLEQAKEKPSARMYAFMMLDKLQPRYKQAVLALKVGEQLKDADKIGWDTVAAFLNAHERTELRLDAANGGGMESAASAKAMAVRSDATTAADARKATWAAKVTPASSSPSRDQERGPRTLADVQCFNCEAFGHMSRGCPLPKKGAPSGGVARRGGTAARGSHGGNAGRSGGGSPRSGKQASAALSSNRFEPLSDSDEDLETPNATEACKDAVEHSYVVAETGRKLAPAACSKEQTSSAWGVDSMASLHISGNKTLFGGSLKRTGTSADGQREHRDDLISRRGTAASDRHRRHDGTHPRAERVLPCALFGQLAQLECSA